MTRASASRATRSRRDLRGLLLALACIAGMMVVRAQDAPPAPQSPPVQEAPPSDETARKPPEGESGGAGEKIDFPDAPDPGAGTTPAARQPEAAPSKASEDAPSDAPDEKSADEEEPPPDAAPRTPGVVGPTPGHFEPTEKVRPDFDVSFPVDI